ncbi:DHHC zinc finger domain containing protein [Trichomonas vaginalis G3]|uniref:Palmitoyltransferase n=1 Tax=Trichomonas vaginalis (strain ATCC PRA-98 / G3) TaxID=412133 RepID=A2F2W7_TRIV3|nr:cysteine S-palmitoyltransferase protein [Trichomonas vaginalis G3]EAY00760.1 DHHC zinc finger domain containing protein [Trichomonas vaginalis G3]KAI5530736.1 cysteine S-palmitoyltransferase protein [Trichomonas vaginalis G3]|eukprot:XP_001313689.1 DHHC zinc finger domain containing protein [Trichomonas vaginalis G3]
MKFAVIRGDQLPGRITVLLLWFGGLGCNIYLFCKYPTLASQIISGIYYFLGILWLWSYFVCCWLDPGYIESYYENQGIKDNILKGEIPHDLENIPKCPKCSYPKPKRTHHCSTCNKCVIYFDHHCPAIGNCVGLYNIKGFILVSFYGGVQLILIAAMLFANKGNQTGGIVAVMFGAVFILFGLSYVFRIGQSKPTIESYQSFSINPYDHGNCSNLKEIYPTIFHFFVPIRPPSDAFTWNDAEFPEYVNNNSTNVNMNPPT